MVLNISKLLGIALITMIGWYILWWNLPLRINRYADIDLGNQLIHNIEIYKNQHGKLPTPGDWEALKRLGFQFEDEVVTPEYQSVNDSTYELIFVEGFDGPYLLWNSQEKNWKIDRPTIPEQLKD